MAVSEADVRHVAALARLALDEARIPALVRELNTILDHMAVLADVPTDGADDDERAPMRLRDDVVDPAPMVRPLESFAPSTRDGFLLVPRLDTHGHLGGEEGDA
ncbi:MAG: Asp-tRNA(Asn)/Glu-tRNA(Gln) amidotransferase subunit GatC [Gemmatimonadaceae bacterium]|jgi:aspartyl-tRNA(Asn)/glutamyl-tRNA(Gln) amidotransferase subunit C|nr:Asp-tRNA(Asn)/Glu-tRNA(Gln) amidotransferase subunit GatC [Gemmatimonadaceae bacterium]